MDMEKFTVFEGPATDVGHIIVHPRNMDRKERRHLTCSLSEVQKTQQTCRWYRAGGMALGCPRNC